MLGRMKKFQIYIYIRVYLSSVSLKDVCKDQDINLSEVERVKVRFENHYFLYVLIYTVM